MPRGLTSGGGGLLVETLDPGNSDRDDLHQLRAQSVPVGLRQGLPDLLTHDVHPGVRALPVGLPAGVPSAVGQRLELGGGAVGVHLLAPALILPGTLGSDVLEYALHQVAHRAISFASTIQNARAASRMMALKASTHAGTPKMTDAGTNATMAHVQNIPGEWSPLYPSRFALNPSEHSATAPMVSATATMNPVISMPPASKMPRYRHSTSQLTDGQAETPSQLNHIDRVRRKTVGNFPRIASTSTTCGW